jgi:hypothetical protein
MKTELPTETCPHCSQRTTYWITISPGVVSILKEMASFIRRKGINAVHPAKEMEALGMFNSTRMGNLTQVKRHGLIAAIEGEPGNYALTRKGLAFLNGEPIPLHTQVRKQRVGKAAETIGHSEEHCTIDQVMKNWKEWWVVEGFDIQSGRVINTPPLKSNPDYHGPEVVEI